MLHEVLELPRLLLRSPRLLPGLPAAASFHQQKVTGAVYGRACDGSTFHDPPETRAQHRHILHEFGVRVIMEYAGGSGGGSSVGQ